MIELDHVVLPVEDLDAAASTLTSAGYVVTPKTEHPFGTANRLVVFEGAYLELVSVSDAGAIPADGFARRVADHLESGNSGFSHVACRATSIGEAGDAVRAAGLEPDEPMWFSRPAPRSDGSEIVASFTLLPITDRPRQFFCIHHTPDAVWFRPHLQHPNGVRSIAEVASGFELVIPVTPVVEGPPRIRFTSVIEPATVAGVEIG